MTFHAANLLLVLSFYKGDPSRWTLGALRNIDQVNNGFALASMAFYALALAVFMLKGGL